MRRIGALFVVGVVMLSILPGISSCAQNDSDEFAITWHSPAAGSEVYGMVRLEVAVSDADALTDIT
ncbi:MAG: hypothetical protein GYB65_09825, partial [Chloroflexi bacterium]|nr:hypothetical protein [Chloroflexota bacterium]